MAKTRGGHSASPSSPTPRPHRAAMGAAASPPVQAPAIPPSEGEAPSQRRYPTRRPPTDPVPPADRAQRPASRPPAKRTKFSGPGESSHAPQAEPPTEEPQIPVENTPETIIRRPMIAGPPIEGNLDCRDRPFHSETYFDIEIQQHLSMQTPLRHDRSAPSEPLVPDEESLPVEQPIPEEEIRAEPSHDPTHI
ncbi:proline-rich receptor-like protein kinase PERK9 [Vitis vinifera]|uniref:proline-rich receptor-like protein kinase PERK9 n=1 Tax=Vitis vinifera TaxID=29760 RepID=UPI002882F8D3|nr:proline-rich receptor-like protein kinase PERK9 [Vitis vinifera]